MSKKYRYHTSFASGRPVIDKMKITRYCYFYSWFGKIILYARDVFSAVKGFKCGKSGKIHLFSITAYNSIIMMHYGFSLEKKQSKKITYYFLYYIILYEFSTLQLMFGK